MGHGVSWFWCRVIVGLWFVVGKLAPSTKFQEVDIIDNPQDTPYTLSGYCFFFSGLMGKVDWAEEVG